MKLHKPGCLASAASGTGSTIQPVWSSGSGSCLSHAHKLPGSEKKTFSSLHPCSFDQALVNFLYFVFFVQFFYILSILVSVVSWSDVGLVCLLVLKEIYIFVSLIERGWHSSQWPQRDFKDPNLLESSFAQG